MKAIIIDDNYTKILLLQHLLETHINNLVVVGRGADAFAAIKKDSFKYVFLDHNLPDCKGSEILGEIKKQYPNAKFVSISNHSDVLSNHKQLGYDDALTHPFVDNVNRILGLA